LLLRMLEGSMWDLWQVARQQNGQAALPANQENSRFVQTSINALSDSFLYGAPVFLQLDSFKQIEASVFQLARAPGENIVYLGSALLVIGIFSMFYVRERRLWIWIKAEVPDKAAGGAGDGDVESSPGVAAPRTQLLMAMSTARKTLDFEKEFDQTRAAIGELLAVPSAPASASPRDAQSDKPQDLT